VTPLHEAASNGHVAVVQLLLSCNAAVDAKNVTYRPYHRIVDENALLFFCCIDNLCLWYSLLISCCFSCFSGVTPLHGAASNGHVAVVQLLLSCNATVDAKNVTYRPYHRIVDENALLFLCCVVPVIFSSDFLLL
jgi:ankyrin repeat protein